MTNPLNIRLGLEVQQNLVLSCYLFRMKGHLGNLAGHTTIWLLHIAKMITTSYDLEHLVAMTHLLLFFYCAVLWVAQICAHFAHYGLMVVFVCLRITLLHYHHYAVVYDNIELLYTCHVHSVKWVSKIKSICSVIFSHNILCIQLTHLSCGDCGIKCSLSFYYHQIGSMTHLVLFRVESWNNGMRCISF